MPHDYSEQTPRDWDGMVELAIEKGTIGDSARNFPIIVGAGSHDRSMLAHQLRMCDQVEEHARKTGTIALCPVEPPNWIDSVDVLSPPVMEEMPGLKERTYQAIGGLFKTPNKHRKNRGVGSTRKASSKRKKGKK